MTSKLAWNFVLTVGFLIAACASAQELPSPQQLVVTANDLADLTALEPYELTATFVLWPGASGQKQGQLGIYRDQEHYRFELRMSDYAETQVVLADQLYIARSQTLPPPGVLALSNLDRLLRVKLPDDAQIGSISARQVEEQQAYCFAIKRPKVPDQQLCFDTSTKLLLRASVGSAHTPAAFLGYTAVKSKVFPQQIKWFDGKEVVLEVRNLKITPVAAAPDLFKVPAADPRMQNLQMQTCDDVTAAEVTRQIDPAYPQMAKIAHIMGIVHLYAIIGTDGRLHQLTVQSGHPLLAQASLDAVKQWEYKPAMCGTTPIPTETELKIKFYIR